MVAEAHKDDRQRATGPLALQCMELWGGNEPAGSAIAVPGVDAWVLARPFGGQHEGGDLYYVSVCGAGYVSRFVLADVAGHGADVGALARRLRRMMRRHINTPNQASLARKINDEFNRSGEDGRFATAVIMTYFAPSDHLIVSNAGHPAPLWYQAQRGEWSLLAPGVDGVDFVRSASEVGERNLPLGIIVDADYWQFAVRLQRGDVIVAYTDSLSEATDAQGRQLGEGGLLALAHGLDPNRPGELAEALLERVRRYAGGRDPQDDLTVLTLSHNAEDPPRATLGNRLRMLGRMMGIHG